MAKLKLEAIEDDRPVKLTIEVPAATHRDLIAYAEILGRMSSTQAIDPAKLIPHMLAKFMASDREFAKRRRERKPAQHDDAIEDKPSSIDTAQSKQRDERKDQTIDLASSSPDASPPSSAG